MPAAGQRTALALFAASAAIYIGRRRRLDEGRGRLGPSPAASDGGSGAGAVAGAGEGAIGSRGRASLKPTLPYLDSFMRCLVDPCHPDTNPRGYVSLCMAENRLVTGLLATRLVAGDAASVAFSSEATYGYGASLGLSGTREAVARFLGRKFLGRDGGGGVIEPRHVAMGSGAASLLNHVCFALAEQGDAVLVPAPYYAAFESDMGTIAGCVPQPVEAAQPADGPTVAELDAARSYALRRGLRPRILLLTNPNNPLGTIYPPSFVRRCILWARERSIHTVVDEIYALSVHRPTETPFESVLKTMEGDQGDDIHLLWALSKDFCASGFRIGVLHSRNEALLRALANLNLLSGVSHPMQSVAASILADDAFVDDFLDRSRAELERAYAIATRKLDEMVVPYVRAEAGMFLYADFSSLLPFATPAGEERFAALVVEAARVVMTPGGSMRDPRPGWFRICTAYYSTHEVLEIALERLSRLVIKIRSIGWENLESAKLRVL